MEKQMNEKEMKHQEFIEKTARLEETTKTGYRNEMLLCLLAGVVFYRFIFVPIIMVGMIVIIAKRYKYADEIEAFRETLPEKERKRYKDAEKKARAKKAKEDWQNEPDYHEIKKKRKLKAKAAKKAAREAERNGKGPDVVYNKQAVKAAETNE